MKHVYFHLCICCSCLVAIAMACNDQALDNCHNYNTDLNNNYTTYCCTCMQYSDCVFKIFNITIATICASVGSLWECFDCCTFEAVVNRIQFYNGLSKGLSKLKPGARISCFRERNNPNHAKAIFVKHYSGEKLGRLSW